MKALLLWLLLCSISLGEDHWATGGWSCRAWGAIRLYQDPIKFATDLDPEGYLQDYGVWQDYDQNSVIIVWYCGRREIIAKESDKYYHQTAYNFRLSSEVEEIYKIIKKDP